MVWFAAQGDARRSMALLWSDDGDVDRAAAPGPRPGLSLPQVVATAVALADAEGMAAVSMRALGRRLGCTGMALYTYVPGKAELVDLMHDRVLGELPTGYDLSAGWRAALRAWAGDMLALLLRHRWLLEMSQARPVLGPNEYTNLDTLAAVLAGSALPPAAARTAVGTLHHFVRGAAAAVVQAVTAAEATGESDVEWWRRRSGALPDVAERFPSVAWLHSDVGTGAVAESSQWSRDRAMATFEAGVATIIAGLDATVPARSPSTPTDG